MWATCWARTNTLCRKKKRPKNNVSLGMHVTPQCICQLHSKVVPRTKAHYYQPMWFHSWHHLTRDLARRLGMARSLNPLLSLCIFPPSCPSSLFLFWLLSSRWPISQQRLFKLFVTIATGLWQQHWQSNACLCTRKVNKYAHGGIFTHTLDNKLQRLCAQGEI